MTVWMVVIFQHLSTVGRVVVVEPSSAMVVVFPHHSILWHYSTIGPRSQDAPTVITRTIAVVASSSSGVVDVPSAPGDAAVLPFPISRISSFALFVGVLDVAPDPPTITLFVIRVPAEPVSILFLSRRI